MEESFFFSSKIFFQRPIYCIQCANAIFFSLFYVNQRTAFVAAFAWKQTLQT